jgi:aminoglycoside phosphotransferase (APT) family kinase protein
MSGRPIDRQSAFTGTRAPSPGLEIDPVALAEYLEAHVPGFRGPVSISLFKGGQSNPTYRLDAASAAYVLRRKPPGKLLPSAHAIEREYRVMQALGKAAFPVPRVLHLCEEPAVIGTAFYVMEQVEGRVIWEPAMPDSNPAERSAVYDALIGVLARLHCFDPAAIGLVEFGRGERYVARQIARWSEQYRASETDNIAEMDRLITWLPQHVPAQSRVAVVHGDFRLDNIILPDDGPEIRAVLDWELSTLGDPVADFTYFLMQWAMPPSESGAGTGSLVGADLAALGIPDMAAAIEAYEARTGLSVRPHLDFYLAYNFFRIAAILQGIVGRVRDGTAANPNAAAMAAQVRPIAETAWRFAEQAKGGAGPFP